MSLASNAQSEKETQLFFIRHAEKEKDGSNDPLLTKKGESRAEYWATVFKNIDFDEVYSTQTSRTIATAKPSAKKDDLEIIIYDTKEIDIKELAKNKLGKNILIVGHSNSTPRLVNALLGNDDLQEIEHSNNSNLYIVRYRPDNVSLSILFIELP